jgi:hypothetical protein
MTSSTIAVGELIYEVTLNFAKVTEYGVSMEAIVSGQSAPPPEGARIDVEFDGTVTGPELKGRVNGVDYLHVRADGRVQLHIHAEITTEDNEKIAFFGDGVAIPEEGTGLYQLRENVTLTTSSPAYSWVNLLQIWGIGTADPGKGQVNVKGYAA